MALIYWEREGVARDALALPVNITRI